MDTRIIPITQEHIDTAVADNNWNGTAILLALRENGLDGSVGFRPTANGGEPEYLHTNEIHPTLEYQLPTLGGYAIRGGLYDWMQTYYNAFTGKGNISDIKPVDVKLVKDGDNWYADTEV